MKIPPSPVLFVPLLKSKPWGGRRLARLFNKALPGPEPIGESWELVSLPGNESRVRGGPLAGRPLADLLRMWGDDLLGDVPPVDGRFPLLIKFLDARENLSVQVHPRPAPDDPGGRRPGIKHEAWYVLDAEPGARLYIGLEPGIGPEDVRRVANTPQMVDLLHAWDGRPEQCYYLPSGTLHALGAGLVVAEVQTPSDITYRAYDWDRTGLDGQPRALHIEESLTNIRYDVTPEMIQQPRRRVDGPFGPAERVVTCDRFVMDATRASEAHVIDVPTGDMRICIVLKGSGRFARNGYECRFGKGDVVLVPAACRTTTLHVAPGTEWIDVTVPKPS